MVRFLLLALAMVCGTAASATDWKLSRDKAPIAPKSGKAAPGGLPDGYIAQTSKGRVKQAWYIQPTRRYGHAILGDAIEAGALTIKTSDGQKLTHTLPDNQVFEDRTPRLVNLGGSVDREIITIVSDVRKGAAVAVFGLVGKQLKLLAKTPFIGRSNRWRNVAGVADFNGDRHLQIAEVVTPHIGGTLRFWTWKDGGLFASGSKAGFSNHAIGSREQDLSAIADFDGDGVADIAVPSANRKAVRIVGFAGKSVREIASIALPAAVTKPMLVRNTANGPSISVGLSDGSTWRIHR